MSAETGASVCNTTVPAGTPLEARFVPYADDQVTWNGTGGAYDTPYGHWNENAAPTSVTCDPAELASTFSSIAWGTVQTYVPFYVNPPTRSVSVSGAGLSCGTLSSNGSAACTASNAGAANVVFQYAPTYGQFFWRARSSVSSCSNTLPNNQNSGYVTFNAPYTAMPQTLNPNSNLRSAGGTAPFKFDIPAQQISCPITVTDGTGNPPSKPTLAAASNSAACTTGTLYSITMSATDPQGSNLRYGIDWNGDGSVDEWVPATGYVPSGTQESASRTYSTAGTKTVKVLAQDTNGLTSSWATLSFSCADAQQTTNTNQTVASFNDASGNGAGTGGGSLTPDLELRAVPSIVAKGGTTKLNWSATNVASCTVTAPNGDLWNTINSIVGGNTSKPITAATTYTLKCLDLQNQTLTKSATVQILPSFQEL